MVEIATCYICGSTRYNDVGREIHSGNVYVVLECRGCGTLSNKRESMYEDRGQGIWIKL